MLKMADAMTMAILILSSVQNGLLAVLQMGTVATEQLGVRLEARDLFSRSFLVENVLVSAELTEIVQNGRPAVLLMDSVEINLNGVQNEEDRRA